MYYFIISNIWLLNNKSFLYLLITIIDKIKKPESIPYILNKDNRVYHPDFIINDTIIEIKSDYWWNKDIDMNEAKREYSVLSGFKYMLILNKNYFDFDEYIKNIQNI